MTVSLDVALSSQMTLLKRLDTVAHNVANSGTAGFRAESTRFASLVSQQTDRPTSFVNSGEGYLSRIAGEQIRTESPLDIAVQGDGWLAVQAPIGTIYTRDGRMQISTTGQLETVNGYPVLDAGGAPIVLDPTAGAPSIARDGMITQDGRQVGAIGLFQIPIEAKMQRYDNSGVIPDQAAEPILDFTQTGVAQGFYEQANVNPVQEMTQLVAITRVFERLNASVNQVESSMLNTIRTLGDSS